MHTPGPWHRNIRANGKYVTVFSGRNNHVAHAAQMEDPAETESNIDLIAAAPEMYELLQQIKQHLDNGGRIWPSNACHDDVNRLMAKIK
jgi:hypothetical protein